jgi:hypothetical protein
MAVIFNIIHFVFAEVENLILFLSNLKQEKTAFGYFSKDVEF